MKKREFDYIIVGAGTAGCVLAWELSTDPKASVLLIEAGDAPEASRVGRPEAWPNLLGSDLDWNWASEPQSVLGGRKLGVPRGRCLGGSSAINVMMHVHGAAEDYDQWQSGSGSGWGHEDLLPLFGRLESVADETLVGRGRAGPMPITRIAENSVTAEAFVAAAQSRGHIQRHDYNTGLLNGVSWLQSTIGSGERYSAARAFLSPCSDRENLTVSTNTMAERLILSGLCAQGVVVRSAGDSMQLFARRELVLCAGAISTPKLLMLSGIGPADHLLAHDIDVIADLSGVGRNLVDHPLLPIGLRADCRPQTGSSGVEALLFGRFDGATRGSPDYQINFGSFLFFPAEMTDGAAGCTLGTVLCHPESRGSVSLSSADPTARPLIDLALLEEMRDRRSLVEALREAVAIARTAGWPMLIGPESDHPDEMMRYALAMVTSNYHPVGTCAMGDSPDSVVDHTLKVHQIEGLRVADASVMPTIVSGNTNATAMVIGAKAGELLRQTRSL